MLLKGRGVCSFVLSVATLEALRVRDGEGLTTEVMLSVSINSELYDDAPIVHRHDSICITSTSVKEERPDPAHLT